MENPPEILHQTLQNCEVVAALGIGIARQVIVQWPLGIKTILAAAGEIGLQHQMPQTQRKLNNLLNFTKVIRFYNVSAVSG